MNARSGWLCVRACGRRAWSTCSVVCTHPNDPQLLLYVSWLASPTDQSRPTPLRASVRGLVWSVVAFDDALCFFVWVSFCFVLFCFFCMLMAVATVPWATVLPWAVG